MLSKAALAAMAGLVSCAGLWIGIHEVPWLGPWLADTARAVVGPTAVARVEDAAYGIEDRWNRAWHGDDAPEALWEVPESNAEPVVAAPTPSVSAASRPIEPLRPVDVGPVHPGFSAQGDGIWVAMSSKRWPNEPPRLHKTLLHPDQKRPWTAVAIVVIDLKRVDLHLRAGQYVPEATEPDGRKAKRPAIIPMEAQPALLAAFNGGFKTIHGRLGMHVDGVTLISPRANACTVAGSRDGHVEIGTWRKRFSSSDKELVWWRQAPTCLVEDGAFGPGVLSDDNVNWGTSVHGSTFIRRSAIGIDRKGGALYVGIGDAISARALAIAMKHAGATHVAQLDVNWTLPKFLTYDPLEPGSDLLYPVPLYEGLRFSRDEYVRIRSPRDFFYVTRRAD